MNPLISLLLLLFSIPASCNSTNPASDKATTKQTAPTSRREMPPNWPWRGVSVESKKTHAADISYLAGVNVNFVRIMLKPDKRAKREKGSPKKAFYAEVAWADSLLDVAKKMNLSCLIAFNNLVLDPTSEINDKSAEFWEEKEYRDSVYAMVEIIANHFKNRGNELAAYEIIGEPAVNRFGKTSQPDEIEGFYKKNLDIIRKYDQRRYFLLTPGPWGKPTNYENFDGYKIDDDRIIYGAHMYLPEPFTHQGVKKRERGFVYPGTVKGADWNKQKLRDQMVFLKAFQQRSGALIYFGEFQSVRWAQGGNQWIKDVLDIFEENYWPWTMYAYQCDTEFWDPYYDVENKNADPSEWQLKYVGPTTDEWKLFLQYFKLNIKE